MNSLLQLKELGQSLWLDSISRELLDGGKLARLVREDGIAGVTSNPSIFEQSIGSGDPAYTREIARLRAARTTAIDAFDLYEALAIRDIRDAADLLRPVYDRTRARDGYVSLEVTLHDGSGASDILGEARHLWRAVNRPNVMIKVPGTRAGIEAFETLIGEGTNVNVTLLFAQRTYIEVAEAHQRGLAAFAQRGGDLARVASVASFFVSRIDTAADKLLEQRIAASKNAGEKERARALLGKIAVANAKLVYEHYQRLFSGPRWDGLAQQGARAQRVLWASTGTKNKQYSDVLYVEELVGPDTVNTAPMETIDAFRDHGKPRVSLTAGVEAARADLLALADLGIDLDGVTGELLADGLKSFGDAFAKLLRVIERDPLVATSFMKTRSMTWKLSNNLETPVARALEEWHKPGGKPGGKIERLWNRDASLWTGADEARWLGWLDAPEQGRAALAGLLAFASEIRAEGFTHVLLLGMGGSSLVAEVFERTFGSRAGHPALVVLDSTDPEEVAAAEAAVDLARTLVIVASKSGSTLEPALFEQFFFERISARLGAANAGRRFVAITDPGSKLEEIARKQGYRKIFAGVPAIGGRFSALSSFGLVPAALIGVDLAALLDGALEIARACCPEAPLENPGVALGVILGLAADSGRDKLTFVLSPRIASFGAWLEQLIAESTGKQRKGIVPIDGEPLGAPDVYGHDRLFVYVRCRAAPDAAQDEGVEALERAGHPVVRIAIEDALDLGGEFFRWEIATAVAGSILAIHPFDQPDVEASKIATRGLTAEVEKTGALPPEKPFLTAGEIELHADPRNAAALLARAGRAPTLTEVLGAHLARAGAGEYFALLAYVARNAEHEAELSALRHEIRDSLRVATCLGFGPRFLHSTGQAYKGGQNSGVFLQITCAHENDLDVPGQRFSFGVVEAAQARGDFQVLADRGRRALRVHVKGGLRAGLARLRHAISQALAQHAEFTR